MKKTNGFLFVMLSALMLLSLAGCAGHNSSDGDASFTTSQTLSGEPVCTTTAPDYDTDITDASTVEPSVPPAETTAAQQALTGGYRVLNYDDFKAMWLSQFDLDKVYKNGSAQRGEASFTEYMRVILKNVKSLGLNTVIVQVRPNADSMYPSEYYPMSKYVVGSYGREASYDPFAIIVEEAHALGLSVQAWINPLRGMTDVELAKVPDKYRIKQWYNDKSTQGDRIVLKSGTWYLNPAYEDVRRLIVDGAREILERYEVDGLHMDDYFYPTTDVSFDSAAYSQYVRGGGRETLADWRRSNLNALVSSLWSMTKEVDPELIFGISPAGNFNTVYDSHYADIYEWCGKTGYIDYICPQAYFGLEHSTYDFNKVVSKYQSMIKTDSVSLIVGMSLGKALNGSKGETDKYAGSGAREWIEHKDILARQLEMTRSYNKCVGVAYFCYQYFFDPLSGSENSGTRQERAAFLPLLEIISWQKS